MKKYGKYIIIALIMFFAFSNVVYATDANLNLCQDEGILKTFQIGGYALYIVKIAVPILLMIFGMVDLLKAVIGSDDSLIKKQAGVLAKRAIAAIVVFLIPTLVDAIFSLITNYTEIMKDYEDCYNCLMEPNDSSVCKAK